MSEIDLKPEEVDDLMEWLASVRNDPVAYVRGAFTWGEGELAKYDGPDIWQLDVLQNIKEGVLTIDEAIRVAQERGEEFEALPIREATTSGHGIGKSALVSWICLWAQDTEVDMKGRVTANTENQLKTTTWAELAKWHRLSITSPLFKMTATARFSMDPAHEKTWRIDMVPWSEKNSSAFAGLHNHGKRILLIFDEASEIPTIIWEVAEGAMTDKNTQIIWCVFGNPTSNSGRFRECFKGGKFAHQWKSRAIDSRTAKMSNKKQLQEWVDTYGEDHDFVRVRVRGMFPRTDATSFIDLELVREAMTAPLMGHNGGPELDGWEGFQPQVRWREPWVIGVDVARYGSDSSTITFRKGLDARSKPPRTFNKISTVQLAAEVVRAFNDCQAQAIFVDVGGVGAGVYDQLEAMGLPVYPVDFGSASDQVEKEERFLNKRAEIWWRMREWLKRGGRLTASIPMADANWDEQLCNLTYTYVKESMTLQLESKKDLKRRGFSSPDAGDSLATTFAYPEMTLSASLPMDSGRPEDTNYSTNKTSYGVVLQ